MKKSAAKILALFAIHLMSLPVLTHDGKPHDFDDLWRTWSFDPLVIVGLVLSAGIYACGVKNLWGETARGRGIGRWEAGAFAAGWISTAAALVSPLHPWGEVLFSAHMTQHEILMLVSAPLFALSRPLVAVVWAVPRNSRQGIKRFLKSKPVDSVWHFLTNPFVAWAIHAVALWVWHVPFLFQATLRSSIVHTFQHLSFFISALLFWWALIAGPRGLKSYGAGVLYLFTTSIHSGLLGVILTLTSTIWYPAYADSTASWGMTPLEDQQLGGLIMWIPAGVVYIVAALFMFAGWLRESDKRARRREKLMYGLPGSAGAEKI